MAVITIPELPSSESLLATNRFVAEAQRYRDEQFEAVMTKLQGIYGVDPEVIEAGFAMLDTLKQYTQEAELREDSIEQISASNRDPEAEWKNLRRDQERSERHLDRIITGLQEIGTTSIQVDCALNEEGGVIAGYRCDADVSAIEAQEGLEPHMLFPHMLSEALFSQGLICRDGTFYHASSRVDSMKDEKGIPIPASREEVLSGLTYLQQKCNVAGMSCSFVYHDYEEIKAQIQAQQVVSATEERVVAAESIPAPVTPASVDSEASGIQPE